MWEECGKRKKKKGAVFQKKILQVSEKSPLRKKCLTLEEYMLISDHPLT